MATLKKANAINGYFMTDSSTWVAGKKDMKHLKILFRGDPMLINTYHVLAVPEGMPNHGLAMEFITFLGSKEGQTIVGEYGTKQFGGAMYDDAEYAKKYDH